MYRLGIDIGGHRTKGLVLDGHDVKEFTVWESPCNRSFESFMSFTAEKIAETAEKYRLDSVGVTVPGIMDPESGIIEQTPNFPDWNGKSPKKFLARKSGLTVKTENDADCHALGEKILGAGRDFDDFILLTLGSGIGGSVFTRGYLLKSSRGRGAEPGHICCNSRNICGCGGIGHLETIAGADWIEKKAAAHGYPADLKTLWENRGLYDEIWVEVLDALAASTASLIHIFDPQAVILGGGLAKGKDFPETLREEVLPLLALPYRSSLKIIRGTLEDRAGAAGAALL